MFFSPKMSLVTSGGTNHLKLWSTRTGKLSFELKGKKKGSNTVAFSRDGSLVAAGTDSGIVQVWDLNSGKLLHVLTGKYGEVTTVAFSPTGKSIAAAGNSKSGIFGHWSTPKAKIWDLETGNEIASFIHNKFEIFTENVVSPKIIFGKDGKTIIAAFGDDINLWNAETGELVKELSDPALNNKFGETSVGGAIRNLNISPDGKYLLTTTSVNGTPRIWDLISGELYFDIGRYAESAEFSPNGELIALGGNGSDVRIFDMISQKERVLEGHKKIVKKVSFSPDGKFLASSDSQLDHNETATIIWDTANWKPIQFLQRQRFAEFGPHGQTLATLDKKNHIQLWSIDCN